MLKVYIVRGIKSGLNACDFDYAIDFSLPRHHCDQIS